MDSLSASDVWNILDNIEVQTIVGRRDRALMALMLSGCCTTSEIVTLKVGDYSSRKGNSRIQVGGKESRTIHFDDRMDAFVAPFCHEMKVSVGNGPLLPAIRQHTHALTGKHLAKGGVTDIFHERWKLLAEQPFPGIDELRGVVIQERLNKGETFVEIAHELTLSPLALRQRLGKQFYEHSLGGCTVPYELLDPNNELPTVLLTAGNDVVLAVAKDINGIQRTLGRKSHARKLSHFFQWCGKKSLSLSQLDDSVIEKYLAELGQLYSLSYANKFRKVVRRIYRLVSAIPRALENPSKEDRSLPLIVQNRITLSSDLLRKAPEAVQSEYRAFLSGSDYSFGAKQWHAKGLRFFEEWCDSNAIRFEDLNYSRIREYAVHLRSKWSDSTVLSSLIPIGKLFDWLMERGVIDRTPVPSSKKSLLTGEVSQKGEKKNVTLLSADDMELFFSTIGSKQAVDLRDRAIIAVFVYAFARSRSIERLKVSDYQAENGRRFLRLEGFDIIYRVPVHAQLEEYLDEYLHVAGIAKKNTNPLFPAMVGGSATLMDSFAVKASGILEMIRRRQRKSALSDCPPLNVDSFRTLGILSFLKSGGTISEARKLMGYKSFSSKRFDIDQSLGIIDIDRIVFSEDESSLTNALGQYIDATRLFSFEPEQYAEPSEE